MSDPLSLSLDRLASALRAGALRATEVVEAALARHERLGPRLHAYKLFDAEAALAAARAADERLAADDDPPPLTGIPISVKDLYGVDGLPTFAGTTRALPERWSRDAWLVRRLRDAGAIIVGKTHMVEMAFGGVGLNPSWETPRNPWDAGTHRIPGGSSSGAGVSLWEGSALVALGSDTGGSIRIPAALTGTVGQRTTKGRWPTTGVVPLSPTFDTVGALTRTVEDSAYFFGCVDPDRGNPMALLAELARTRLAETRIAVPVCEIQKACQPDIGDVLHGALGELGSAGARLSEVDGRLLDQAFDLSLGGGTIAATECRQFLQSELPGWLETLHPIVGDRVARAVSTLDPLYEHGIAEQKRLASEAHRLFEHADVLAMPANLITPPAVSGVDDQGGLERYLALNRTILRPTYPVSVLGLTAISVPVGLDGCAMPVGLQLVAPGGRDEELLGVALAVERELGSAAQRLGTPPALLA